MTGPEPKSADLIATEPTTVLPWEQVRAVLADTRLYGWLPYAPTTWMWSLRGTRRK